MIEQLRAVHSRSLKCLVPSRVKTDDLFGSDKIGHTLFYILID